MMAYHVGLWSVSWHGVRISFSKMLVPDLVKIHEFIKIFYWHFFKKWCIL